MQNTIMIVVDPQNVYFDADLLPVANAAISMCNIVDLLHNFEGLTVLFQHRTSGDSPFNASNGASASGDIHPALTHIPFRIKRTKTYASCFTETDLSQIIQQHMWKYGGGVQPIIYVVGYQSHHCVVSTALEAAAYGRVVVVRDACSSPMLQSAESPHYTIGAESAHAAAMAACAQFCCEVSTTPEVLESWAQ